MPYMPHMLCNEHHIHIYVFAIVGLFSQLVELLTACNFVFHICIHTSVYENYKLVFMQLFGFSVSCLSCAYQWRAIRYFWILSFEFRENHWHCNIGIYLYLYSYICICTRIFVFVHIYIYAIVGHRSLSQLSELCMSTAGNLVFWIFEFLHLIVILACICILVQLYMYLYTCICLCNCGASQPPPAVRVVHVDGGQFVAQDWPSLPSPPSNFYFCICICLYICICSERLAQPPLSTIQSQFLYLYLSLCLYLYL